MDQRSVPQPEAGPGTDFSEVKQNPGDWVKKMRFPGDLSWTFTLTGENTGAICPTTDTGCADKGLEPMVSRASMQEKHVDLSSFKPFLKESSTEALLGVNTAEATDWLRFTGSTTLTCEGSIKTSDLTEDFFSLRSL